MKTRVRFELTHKQTELLEEYFEELGENTGMILGQFHPAKEGPGFCVVGFIPNDKAMHLQKCMGIEPGKMTEDVCCDVYIGME